MMALQEGDLRVIDFEPELVLYLITNSYSSGLLSICSIVGKKYISINCVFTPNIGAGLTHNSCK
jgi:hypothetical protein